MAKLKAVLPSLRERKRYIVFEILSEKKITDAFKVQMAIEQAMLNYTGVQGAASAGMIFLKEAYQDNLGLIKVSNIAVDTLKGALTFITHIENDEVIVRSKGVSGSIKKTDKFIAS